MWKNMSLAAKLAVGFGVVVFIAITLGTIAVVNMKSVQKIANILIKENVPEVAVANNIERWSLKTMYEMRGYAYTEENQFLTASRENLKKVNDYLKEAQAQGMTSPRLAKLKESAESAETSAMDYEKLVNETVDITRELQGYRAASEKAAQAYMNTVNQFLDLQDKQIKDELNKDTVDKKAVEMIIRQNNLANDLQAMGNTIIIDAWKSQFFRNPDLLTGTVGIFEKLYKKSDELRTSTEDADDIKLIEENKAAAKEFQADVDKFLAAWLKREDVNKKRQEVAGKVLELAKSTAELGMADTKGGSEKAGTALSVSSTVMIVGLLVGTGLAIILAVLIAIGITGAITKVVKSLDEGSDQTTSAALQVSASSQQLSQGATEQASSLEETSSALDEMASMTKQNADNAAKANQMATETKSHAEKGDAAMKEMQSAMTAIGESAEKVGRIIKTIEEIAFQTNLLALNAAVEAARAGEHGKGFAVVADEVRNLAQRASGAAKDTQQLIENSQTRTKEGAEIARRAGQALTQISEAAKKVADVVSEIAVASKEQAEGIDQVTHAVSQMDQVTQQNAASAEESAAAAEELSSQADNLKDMVGELQHIVGGANAKLAADSNYKALKGIERRKALHPATAMPRFPKKEFNIKAEKGPKVFKPEDVMPFNDKEGFKDF